MEKLSYLKLQKFIGNLSSLLEAYQRNNNTAIQAIAMIDSIKANSSIKL